MKSAFVSVLVNGSPSEEVKMERGLRQGDPLSPFLFLFIGEALNQVIKAVVTSGKWKGITLGKEGSQLSHLQFADDLIV